MSTRNTRLSIRRTRLSTRSICLPTRSTRSICRSFYNRLKLTSTVNRVICYSFWQYTVIKCVTINAFPKITFWTITFFSFPNDLTLHPLHKKWSFPLRISSVNVTKSAGKPNESERRSWRYYRFCFSAFISRIDNLSPTRKSIYNLIDWDECNIGRICTQFSIVVLFD